MDSRASFHMEWWNPCGIHSIPYGIWVEWNHQNDWDITQNIFHVEWVESTWNDMDSIWIPCGMWGESKDLNQARHCSGILLHPYPRLPSSPSSMYAKRERTAHLIQIKAPRREFASRITMGRITGILLRERPAPNPVNGHLTP